MQRRRKANIMTLWGLILVLLLSSSCTSGEPTSTQVAPTFVYSPSPENILFEVSIKDSSCKNTELPVELVLTFTNPNVEPLRLADQFILSKNRHGSGGNIIPTITLEEEDIYALLDNSMMDVPLPDVATYIEIPPHGTVSQSIQYFFPREILESGLSNQEVIITPSPGIYHVTFTYFQVDRDLDNWHGYVRSNQVEICIT